MFLRLADIYKQEESAPSGTCPDKWIATLNLELCFDNISPCFYYLKWIFISLWNQMAYTQLGQ